MIIEEYIESLPGKRILSDVKLKILRRLWGKTQDDFPKPWASSAELLEITGQKYFDRRIRELRDQVGCDLETAYQESFAGHAWRINSPTLTEPQDREYLTKSKKIQLFEEKNYCCSTCGIRVDAGVRGLQADHKVPLSRGGNNGLENWQPMCNNCNVGKRRACQGCNIDCNSCSWAFPEIVGVKTMILINEGALRRIDSYSSSTGTTRDKVMEEAVEYFLAKKDS
jgi:5-methylcytosine-specific restriction endonuclease McrA